MRIAICDDDIVQINQVEKLLYDYRTPDGYKAFIDVYTNALDMIAAMQKTQYDVLLLDIIMPLFSGIDAAKDIRLSDMDTPIVFLTNSSEYAVESYKVHAFDYIIKPVGRENLYKVLNAVFALKKNRLKESLTIRSASIVYSIPYYQIEYVEINNRMLQFHTMDGNMVEIRGKLSDYEDDLLHRPNFLKIHRSYIINMDNMKFYDKKSFTAMTGEVIPVSRNLIKEIQESYMNYLHSIIRR